MIIGALFFCVFCFYFEVAVYCTVVATSCFPLQRFLASTTQSLSVTSESSASSEERVCVRVRKCK